MQTRKKIAPGILTAALGASLVCCGVALAHQGVLNPDVKARMDGMSAISRNLKILGTMAKGAISFDVEAARLAAAEIARHAEETPGLFDTNATDPKSEAKPNIWMDFDDFTGKATKLEKTARKLSKSITSIADVRMGMGQLGDACKSCHSVYRK